MSARKAPGEVSVTEVRNALRCPRVFALGRSRGAAVAFPVGASSLGATFHRIAERFANELESPPAEIRALRPGAPRDAIVSALEGWVLRHLVAALDASPALASMPAEVDDLAEALRELARYLALEIERGGAAASESLRALVRHAELEVEAVLDTAGGVPVRLAGRVDAVHARGSGAIDVVEYKLTGDANQELDQAQVALYRRLLRASLDVDAEPVILRFNPGLIATRLSPSAADTLVERTLLPLLGKMVGWAGDPASAPATERQDLCPACPVRAACAETYGDRLDVRDKAPATAAFPRPKPEGGLIPASTPPAEPRALGDPAGAIEAEELEKLIVAELRKQGVSVQVAKRTAGPRLVQLDVVVARARVNQLDRHAEDVEHRLADRGVRFEKNGGKRIFSAPRRDPRKVDLDHLLALEAAYLRERPGRFVVGEGADGGVVVGDLSDGSTPHLLIAGQAGSGKSVLLRGIVTSLARFHPPGVIRFTLVDPKRVTFGGFAARVAAHLEGPVIYDCEALLPELEDLVAEMEDRYLAFERAGVQDLQDYNELAPTPLPRRVVVVDEFADLLVDKATTQAFLDVVRRLGAKARAAGIHLVCATQRPDRTTVPGAIKANLGGKIALKVQAQVNSRIILDQGGAEHLLGHGDLLADLGHGVVRAQAALV